MELGYITREIVSFLFAFYFSVGVLGFTLVLLAVGLIVIEIKSDVSVRIAEVLDTLRLEKDYNENINNTLGSKYGLE